MFRGGEVRTLTFSSCERASEYPAACQRASGYRLHSQGGATGVGACQEKITSYHSITDQGHRRDI